MHSILCPHRFTPKKQHTFSWQVCTDTLLYGLRALGTHAVRLFLPVSVFGSFLSLKPNTLDLNKFSLFLLLPRLLGLSFLLGIADSNLLSLRLLLSCCVGCLHCNVACVAVVASSVSVRHSHVYFLVAKNVYIIKKGRFYVNEQQERRKKLLLTERETKSFIYTFPLMTFAESICVRLNFC